MDLNKIRKMTDQERTAELERMKQELFNLRFQHVTGQLENPVRMREVRRDKDHHERGRAGQKRVERRSSDKWKEIEERRESES